MYSLICSFIKIKTKQEREKQLSFKHPLQNQWEERAIEICTFYLSYVFIFIHISGNIIYVKVISHLHKIFLYLSQAAFRTGMAKRFNCYSDSKRLIVIYGWVCWNNFKVILESVVKNVIMECVWGKNVKCKKCKKCILIYKLKMEITILFLNSPFILLYLQMIPYNLILKYRMSYFRLQICIMHWSCLAN